MRRTAGKEIEQNVFPLLVSDFLLEAWQKAQGATATNSLVPGRRLWGEPPPFDLSQRRSVLCACTVCVCLCVKVCVCVLWVYLYILYDVLWAFLLLLDGLVCVYRYVVYKIYNTVSLYFFCICLFHGCLMCYV